MRQVTTRRTTADQLVLVGDQIKKVMIMVTDNKEEDVDVNAMMMTLQKVGDQAKRLLMISMAR